MSPTLAALFVLAAGPAAPADPQDAAVQVIRPAGRGNGSGVAVRVDGGSTWVLTCRHVVSDGTGAADGTVRWDWTFLVRSRGRAYPAELKGYDSAVDVAVLKVPAVLPVAPIAQRDPAKGDPVRMFGYGGPPQEGKALGFVNGNVQGKGVSLYVTFRPVGGDSGAGVFNAQGEVVGVNWGVSNTLAAGAAVSAADCEGVLDNVIADRARPKPAAQVPPKPEPPPAVFRRPAAPAYYATQPYRPQDCAT
jgi:S1-C subfamily serine protease